MFIYTINMSLQETFDALKEEDFIKIANSAYESVSDGTVKSEVLVNLSTPDVMIFDPVLKPEYKHMLFKIDGKEILICIGLD